MSARNFTALLVLGLAAAEASARCADVALVLAIDASGSIDDGEYHLQRQGYARAFAARRVHSALSAAGEVDVGVVLWGDGDLEPQILPLRRLRSSADAEAFSAALGSLPRLVTGNTGIGRGLGAAVDLLETPGTCALRRVINVSGDGVETVTPFPSRHESLRSARARALERGITVNALAIETDRAELPEWYRVHLIAGTDAFVMEASGFESFAAAIEEKLVREIAPPALATADPRTRTGSAAAGLSAEPTIVD